MCVAREAVLEEVGELGVPKVKERRTLARKGVDNMREDGETAVDRAALRHELALIAPLFLRASQVDENYLAALGHLAAAAAALQLASYRNFEGCYEVRAGTALVEDGLCRSAAGDCGAQVRVHLCQTARALPRQPLDYHFIPGEFPDVEALLAGLQRVENLLLVDLEEGVDNVESCLFSELLAACEEIGEEARDESGQVALTDQREALARGGLPVS